MHVRIQLINRSTIHFVSIKYLRLSIAEEVKPMEQSKPTERQEHSDEPIPAPASQLHFA